MKVSLKLGKVTLWIESTMARLNEGEVESVIWGLQRMNAPSNLAFKTAENLITYLRHNKHRIDYDRAKRGHSRIAIALQFKVSYPDQRDVSSFAGQSFTIQLSPESGNTSDCSASLERALENGDVQVVAENREPGMTKTMSVRIADTGYHTVAVRCFTPNMDRSEFRLDIYQTP